MPAIRTRNDGSKYPLTKPPSKSRVVKETDGGTSSRSFASLLAYEIKEKKVILDDYIEKESRESPEGRFTVPDEVLTMTDDQFENFMNYLLIAPKFALEERDASDVSWEEAFNLTFAEDKIRGTLKTWKDSKMSKRWAFSSLPSFILMESPSWITDAIEQVTVKGWKRSLSPSPSP